MDAWLATGPTTRKAIRIFFVFAKKTGANRHVQIGYYTAKGRPVVPQEQRLAARREPLRQHRRNRPILRTGSGTVSPWLFPGFQAAQHLHPNGIMARLRAIGFDLAGTRNTAADERPALAAPPLVADALGHGHQVESLHADAPGKGGLAMLTGGLSPDESDVVRKARFSPADRALVRGRCRASRSRKFSPSSDGTSSHP